MDTKESSSLNNIAKQVISFFPHNPYYKKTGAHVRCMSMLSSFSQLGHAVTLVSSNLFADELWDEISVRGLKEKYGIDVFLYQPVPEDISFVHDQRRNFRYWESFVPPGLLKYFSKIVRSKSPDMIFINYAYWGGLLKGLEEYNTVIDTHDLLTLNEKMQKALKESIREIQQGDRKKIIEILDEAYFENMQLKIELDECGEIERFKQALFISKQEAEVASRYIHKTKIHYFPMSFSTVDVGNTYENAPVFVIGKNIFNFQGYLYLINRIIPRLKNDDLLFHVLGKGAVDLFSHDRVKLSGFIENLSSVYQRAAFSICPLIGGTGQQVKIVESMAYGVPVVALANVAQSSPISHGVNGFIAKNSVEFARYCEILHEDRSLCRKLGVAARQTILQQYSDHKILARLNGLF